MPVICVGFAVIAGEKDCNEYMSDEAHFAQLMEQAKPFHDALDAIEDNRGGMGGMLRETWKGKLPDLYAAFHRAENSRYLGLFGPDDGKQLRELEADINRAMPLLGWTSKL